MSQPTMTQNGGTGIGRFQDVLSELTNKLLDSWYEIHPESNAFSLEYESVGSEPAGRYLIGRENGSDGSDDEQGFDYFYRRFQDPESWSEETEYVYGKYGWMDANSLSSEVVLLRQVINGAVEQGLLTSDAETRFESAVEQLETDMRSFRDQYTLADIAERLEAHDIDVLRRLLATGDEEGRVLWQTLFSKDEDDSIIENPLDIPVQSEQHQFMLVRTDRYYYDETDGGGHYAYGIVIGYDDTPDRFFVHRLESDADLKNSDFEWTPETVTQKLGFDTNLSEHRTSTFPFETRVRVQGDLVLVRHDLQDERQERIDSAYVDAQHELIRAHSEQVGLNYDGVTVTHSGSVWVSRHETDALKQLQDEAGIAEETVRSKQSDRDWPRLTAGRRNEIVGECLREQAFRTACEATDKTPTEVKANIRDDVDAALTDVQQQSNDVIGNHTVIFGNAREPSQRRSSRSQSQGTYIVPDEGSLFVIHDEHDNKQLQLGAGVYEFQFLDGFETEAWMNG